MPLTPDEKILFSKALPLLPTKPVVFDVGAYKGEYSEHVLSICPDAQCYLFEPNADLYGDLSKKYNAFNIVVSDTDGVALFHKCPEVNGELSSMISRPVFDDLKMADEYVNSITVDSFCEMHNISQIDFLKIDVEGAEFLVLKGAIEMLNAKRISFLQVEYGGTYLDAGVTFSAIIRSMTWLDYRIYELVGDKLTYITEANFVEDYRYTNFLMTLHELR